MVMLSINYYIRSMAVLLLGISENLSDVTLKLLVTETIGHLTLNA